MIYSGFLQCTVFRLDLKSLSGLCIQYKQQLALVTMLPLSRQKCLIIRVMAQTI